MAPDPAPETPSGGSNPARFVRPYALTGGRTRPTSDLAVEAQVTSTPISDGQRNSLTPEQRRIVELCEHPLSVAEIAALAHLPLGVARILIADLREDGLVVTGGVLGSESGGAVGSPTDVTLLERVLNGLRSL